MLHQDIWHGYHLFQVLLTVIDGTEMIGGKLHLNLIFRQLERTEHDTCIVSAKQKDFGQVDSVKCR